MAKVILHTSDIVRLVNPGHNEPAGNCILITDQRDGGLIWFRAAILSSLNEGPYYVARPGAVKLIRRNEATVDFHRCDSITTE